MKSEGSRILQLAIETLQIKKEFPTTQHKKKGGKLAPKLKKGRYVSLSEFGAGVVIVRTVDESRMKVPVLKVAVLPIEIFRPPRYLVDD